MRSNYENIVYRDIIMNSQNNSNAQNQPNAEKNKEVDNNDYYKSTDKTEKQENEKNPQNDKNYGRTTGLYSEKMLKKTLRQHFITIPQPGEEPIRRYYYNKEDLPEEIIEDVYGQTDQQAYDIANYKWKVKQQQNDMK